MEKEQFIHSSNREDAQVISTRVNRILDFISSLLLHKKLFISLVNHMQVMKGCTKWHTVLSQKAVNTRRKQPVRHTFELLCKTSLGSWSLTICIATSSCRAK